MAHAQHGQMFRVLDAYRRVGDTMCRGAAFVFTTASGVAWVDTSYTDPWGASSPAMRHVEGTLQRHASGFKCEADGKSFFLCSCNFDDPTNGIEEAIAKWKNGVRLGGGTFEASGHRFSGVRGLNRGSVWVLRV